LLRRLTLTSQVVDYVLSLIKSGTVKPGQQLPTEMQLVAQLGVSRTCVREAMKSLESLKVLSIRPRVGATVLEPVKGVLRNAERFSEALHGEQTDVLLEFRKIMETGVAALAAVNADESDLEAMRAALALYRSEIEQKHVDCCTDMSFHMAVVKASKNPIAMIVWEMISSRLTEVLAQAGELPNVPHQTLKDHQAILDAIESGDARHAREAMRKHLENADRVWRIVLSRQPAASNGG